DKWSRRQAKRDRHDEQPSPPPQDPNDVFRCEASSWQHISLPSQCGGPPREADAHAVSFQTGRHAWQQQRTIVRYILIVEVPRAERERPIHRVTHPELTRVRVVGERLLIQDRFATRVANRSENINASAQ